MAMDRILLGHGSGGRLMHELIAEHFAPAFDIRGVTDSAVLEMPAGAGGGKLAVTTDSFVVSPLFFPGGNIGDLAINGTVNDLAVSGGRPLYLTAGFIIEEGFPFGQLKKIVASMAEAARQAGVRVVAGDTKVVEKGKGDGLFINTSGVGVVPADARLGPGEIRAGDRILISGSIGNHGIAVMAERGGLSFDPPVLSDTAPLNGLCETMLACGREGVKAMRDPTRGGLATTLKEFAADSGLCMVLAEDELPLAPGVRGACDLLGLDPLYVANEGVLVAVVSPGVAEYVLASMRKHPRGKDAHMVGEVTSAPPSKVLVKTAVGGKKMVEMLQGEQLPRIC